MHSCICGSNSSFHNCIDKSLGFDHNSYKPLVTKKKYRVCRNCFSIYRKDKFIRNPFNSQYVQSTHNCIIASQRLEKIAEFIIQNLVKRDIKNICDFGGGDGYLFDLIKKYFPGASFNIVEIRKSNKNSKYNYYPSINSVINEKKIDLFIASNSLLYTDYSELASILADKYSPSYLILAGPDFINRPTQLFYDDVRYNASRKGLGLFLNRFGYFYKESDFFDSNNNEYLILGIKNHFKIKQKEIKKKEFDENICFLKNEIILNYKNQAEIFKREKKITIFGTSIDSAILSSFIKQNFNFTKDLICAGEKFMGKDIISIKDVKGKLLIPNLIPNRERILEKFKNNTLVDIG